MRERSWTRERDRRLANISPDEYGDVLSVEQVAVRSAVDAPEMVIVDFRGGSAVDGVGRGKNLAVDGSVFRFDERRGVAGLELGGNVGAVMRADEKLWGKLQE